MRRSIGISIVALLLALAACGDDGGVLLGATTATSEATATSTVQSTTTTATVIAPTTTAEATTTSMVEATTTTVAAATTTTATTMAPPPAGPLLFHTNGLSIVPFGTGPPATISAVESFLGFPPTFDSGWVGAYEYGVCPGTEFRMVSFDGFHVMFTDAGYFAPEGTRQFFAYLYDGDPPGITPGPPQTIDIGTTVGQMLALYPGAEVYGDDPIFGPTFRVAGPGPYDQLWGRTTGDAPADTIETLQGGIGCGE